MSMPPPGSQPPGSDEPAGDVPPGSPPGWSPSPPGGAVPPPGANPPSGGFQPPPPYQPPGEQAPPPGTGGYGPPSGAPAGGYPPPGGYQQAGYPPPGGVPSPAAATGPLAEWPQRALGGLIDFVAPWIVVAVVSRVSTALGSLLWLASLGWFFYNAYLNGTTGQSIGKQSVGLKVVSAETGQTIGGGMGIARAFLHILDGIPCYIGYLWPLWDAKKQTFADKVVKTVVIVVPK